MSVPAIPAGRVGITDLLALSIRAVSQPDFRAEAYRKHREAWVLGHFAVIYNDLPECLHRLEFAELGDSASIPADFATYDAAGALVADAEIAELTDVWEWWRPGKTIAEVDDPWGHISRLLRQKGQKAERYRAPTWLIVYDNASSGIFGTLRYETGPLVDGPKVFGAVRAIMCDIDCVAALFGGWDGQDLRRIATAEKFRTFLETVFPAIG